MALALAWVAITIIPARIPNMSALVRRDLTRRFIDAIVADRPALADSLRRPAKSRIRQTHCLRDTASPRMHPHGGCRQACSQHPKRQRGTRARCFRAMDLSRAARSTPPRTTGQRGAYSDAGSCRRACGALNVKSVSPLWSDSALYDGLGSRPAKRRMSVRSIGRTRRYSLPSRPTISRPARIRASRRVVLLAG